MIPIRDEIQARHTPVVNYLLIAANVLVFLIVWLAGPSQQQALITQFALVPAQITSGLTLDGILHIFTSMFMHGGWAHLLGNMLYLWIFGDNVEDSMGHVKYLLFYLAGGVIASFTHIFTNPASQIPTVGASGAIAAVLGAYLVLYPNARVLTFIPLGFFMRLTAVPAVFVLGLWFVLQLLSGVTSLGATDVGGVAFWAHIGGFIAGVLFGKLLAAPSRRDQEYVVRW